MALVPAKRLNSRCMQASQFLWGKYIAMNGLSELLHVQSSLTMKNCF